MNAGATALAPPIAAALQAAHPSWQAALRDGLAAVEHADPGYLARLGESSFFPTDCRLFAAFSQPLPAVRYVLVGEGPYPRQHSATGYCFMDGAVTSLWSTEADGGLSKTVNRATSLRNFMKMLLVAGGYLAPGQTGSAAIAAFAQTVRQSGSGLIETLGDLQRNMLANGFLLLNASLVFRPEVAPQKDAKAWQPFLHAVLSALHRQQQSSAEPVTLVLWGKIAAQLQQLPVTGAFPHAVAEHPYNLSFIDNAAVQDFFRPMRLLEKRL